MSALGRRPGSTASNRRRSWLRQAWLVINAAIKARDAQRLHAAILTCVQHLAAIDGNSPEAEEARSCFGSSAPNAAVPRPCCLFLGPFALDHPSNATECEASQESEGGALGSALAAWQCCLHN